MKKLFTLLAALLMIATTANATAILGQPVSTPQQMYNYVKKVAPNTTCTITICQEYYNQGKKYGIRGDIAFAQACVETGNFCYVGGTAVTASDHNYCGLGVTQTGVKGAQFDTEAKGVSAHLQHLWRYATTAALPSGWTLYDPRFYYVTAGKANNSWEGLNNAWAMTSTYSTKILNIYNAVAATSVDPPTITFSPTALDITVDQNATSPTYTVKVTVKNNYNTLRVACPTSKLTITKASDWSDTAGGTLQVKVNTSAIYSGETYIAVECGSSSDNSLVRKQLTVKLNILGPAELKANPASVTLTGTKGGANATGSFKVTASNLTKDLTVSSASSYLTATTGSDWNARTGGTVNLSASMDRAVGSYETYVVVQTSSTQRVQVPVTIVINEPESTDPSLKANVTSFTLDVQQGGTSPTYPITITGKNLTSKISYNTTSSVFKVAAASGWNDLTGGTLNVTLDSSKEIKSYTGNIVVQSGTQRLEIAGTANILDPTVKVPDPVLSTTTTSVSLTGRKGETAPTQNIIVKGENLTANISYNSSTGAVKLTPGSDWNDRTGGTMVATLNLDMNAATYTGKIAFVSGSQRVEIPLTATINAAAAPVTPDVPTLSFKEIWKTNHSGVDMRNFDYADGKLYCVLNKKQIQILDAHTGEEKGTLSNGSVVTGGTYTLCDVVCHNGKIYACNLSTNTTKFRVYRWASDSATPELVFEADKGSLARLGDTFTMSGDDNNLWFTLANGSTIAEWNVKGQQVSSTTLAVTNTDGSALALGSTPRVYRTSDGYVVDGSSVTPTVLNSKGVKQNALATSEKLLSGTDYDTFTYNNTDYLLNTSYLNVTEPSKGLTEGCMQLYDVSNGWAKATLKGSYPSDGLGTTRNTNFSGSLEVNMPHSACVEAWILVTGQGFAYYRSGDLTVTPVNPDPVNPDPVDPQPTTKQIPDKFIEVWNYSVAKNNVDQADYMSTAAPITRGIAKKGYFLYVVTQGKGKVDIVEAYNGKAYGTLPTTGITSDTYNFTSVDNMGGTIVACNMAISATGTLRVYGWKDNVSAPTLILETTNHGGRAGDRMSASGTIDDGKLYFTTNSAFSGFEGRLYVYTVKNGKANATPQEIVLKNASGAAYNLGDGYAIMEVKALSDGTLQVSGGGGKTAWFKADGTFIRELNAQAYGSSNTKGASAEIIEYGDYKFAAVTAYESNYQKGHLVMANITDANNPTVLKRFDNLCGTTASNQARSTYTISEVDSNNHIHMWTLIPWHGIAMYTATNSTTGVDDIVADDNQDELDTEAPVEYYNLNGVRVNGDNLNSGIYIRRQGTKVTKILVR